MDPRGRWHRAAPQESNLRAGLGWLDKALNAAGLQGIEYWAWAQASWGVEEASSLNTVPPPIQTVWWVCLRLCELVSFKNKREKHKY